MEGASESSELHRAYLHSICNEPLIYENVGQCLKRAAAKYGKHFALISCLEGARLTYDEVLYKAAGMVITLRVLGLQPGDNLGVWTTSSTQLFITHYAAALGDFPLVLFNNTLKLYDLEYALKKSKVKILITEYACGKQHFYDLLIDLLGVEGLSSKKAINVSKFPHLRQLILKGDKSVQEFTSWDELYSAHVSSKDIELLLKNVERKLPEYILYVIFTSGTTGLPKVSMLRHFSCINQSRMLSRYMRLDEGHNNVCLPLPLFHIFRLVAVLSALRYGSTIILLSPTYSGSACLKAIAKERCNVIIGTSTMFVDMMQRQIKLKLPISTLRYALSGGANVPASVFTQIKNVLELKYFTNGYGMSETYTAGFVQDGSEDPADAVRTIGRPFEHIELKMIDDEGKLVRFGERGQLCVRGYCVMAGYLDDEEKTREVLHNFAWLKTG